MRCFSAILAGLTALTFAGCSCDDREQEVSVYHERTGDLECGAFVLIPEKYETVMEEVCVQQPSVRKELVEAQYQTVCDTVVDQPGRWNEIAIPAEYKDVTEQVQVSPGRREWQKVPCAKVPLNAAAGEKRGDAYCLVDIPPQFETQSKRVVCREATVKREWIPPTYKTVERRVMVSAAREVEVPVEGRFEMRERRTLVSPSRWEWRWGSDCEPGEVDTAPKADQPSPAPPIPLGSSSPPHNFP
jgi:hypothetical protein